VFWQAPMDIDCLPLRGALSGEKEAVKRAWRGLK
jgi:hypothetical protein